MKAKKELSIGIFTVVVILGSFFLINYLRGNNIFQKTNTHYSVFDNIEGLTPSTPVYLNGYKIGSINDITYLKDTRQYKVTYELKQDFEIPEDSYCELYSADILGGKAFRIVPGSSTVILDDDTEIKSAHGEDMISSLMSGLPQIKEQAGQLLANLNESVSRINALLDEENTKAVSDIISDLEKSVREIKGTLTLINSKRPEINNIINQADTLSTRLKLSAEKLDYSLANIAQVTDDLKESGLKESLLNIKDILGKIQNSQGTVGQLINSDSLYNNINSLTANLDSLVKKIEKNPKKYLKISVF